MPLQRLFESALATAASNGTAQFNFPTPPTMLVWEGSLGVVGVPISAQFFAFIGGSEWCSWAGNNTGGPVQALPGEQLIITATGLTPGVQYSAQWIGFSISRNDATLKYPSASSSAGGLVTQAGGSSLTTTLLGGALRATGTTASAGTTPLLPAPASGTNYALHNVTFLLGSGATSVQIVGHSTGFVYAQGVSTSQLFEPLMGQVVATEGLDVVSFGGGATAWLSYDLTTPVPSSVTGGGHLVTFGTATSAGSGTGVDIITMGGYSTQQNDCIVVGLSSGAIPGSTLSGAGATWIQHQPSVNYVLAVGYACPVGSLTFTLATAAGAKWELVWAILTGVHPGSNPVTSHAESLSGTNIPSVVITPQTGEILIGSAGYAPPPANVWTTDTADGWVNIAQSNVNRSVTLDWQPAARSTSVTYQSTGTSGNVNTGAEAMALLTP